MAENLSFAIQDVDFDRARRSVNGFPHIIGSSAAFDRVIQAARMVAPTDATVLIQGETGTGKELIAEAIHQGSARAARPFVRVNCAAIPSGLLESELFGHERGAFTGALTRVIGRFERADKGTIFFDEIGDLPPELQPKLLRVLQEHEFERLGGTATIRADVRVICATNQNLVDMVNQRQFRADLYYRLGVFPITLPPLREHPEDIPLLVDYFVRKYAQRMNKPIPLIPAAVQNTLRRYSWPGNVRELQNFIERSVILTSGPLLNPPLNEIMASDVSSKRTRAGTLEDLQRSHIVETLRQTEGVIGGAHGAAARLGVPRTTLIAKMRRLGIDIPRSHDASSPLLQSASSVG
jgi:formate hydrogenlyase transcriptional activator